MNRRLRPAEPVPLSPAVARGLKQRLLERVADADISHLTVAADQGPWQPFLAGVAIKVLREHDGLMSYLLRLAPGAAVPPHRHRADEECIVLDGEVTVGSRITLGPGGYHLAHRGALHARLASRTGATVFLHGATPDPGDLLG